MRSGALNRTVELWKKDVIKDGFGSLTETWVKVKNLRSYTKRRNGRQTVENDEIFAINRISIELRNQHDIEEMDRIKYSGKMYEIDFIQPDMTERWITVKCSRINE